LQATGQPEPAYRREHREWVAATLERLGPRPEIRLVHRTGEGEVPRTFEQFVGASLTRTPDHILLRVWRGYTLHDPTFKAV
jgi:hypothetical protein